MAKPMQKVRSGIRIRLIVFLLVSGGITTTVHNKNGVGVMGYIFLRFTAIKVWVAYKLLLSNVTVLGNEKT